MALCTASKYGGGGDGEEDNVAPIALAEEVGGVPRQDVVKVSAVEPGNLKLSEISVPPEPGSLPARHLQQIAAKLTYGIAESRDVGMHV